MSDLRLQEAEEAVRKERRVAALLIERIGNPEMRRAFEHRRTGVVAGLLPAWRAARMNPVDALRAE